MAALYSRPCSCILYCYILYRHSDDVTPCDVSTFDDLRRIISRHASGGQSPAYHRGGPGSIYV